MVVNADSENLILTLVEPLLEFVLKGGGVCGFFGLHIKLIVPVAGVFLSATFECFVFLSKPSGEASIVGWHVFFHIVVILLNPLIAFHHASGLKAANGRPIISYG